MASTILLSDNGVSSGSAGLKQTAGNDGVLILQTTTSSGTATNAVTIDTSQNVGIGASSPSTKFHVYGGNATVQSSTSGDGNIRLINTGASYLVGMLGSANSTALSFYDITNSAERMRIDSSGNLLVGRTDPAYLANQAGIVMTPNAACVFSGNGTAAKNLLSFVNGIGGTPAEIGRIQTSGSATSYQTSSDYRLKENIAPMTGALDVVQQLKPVTYNWKSDGSNGQGFIAHELQEVVPECVGGEKDAVNEDGSPQYQGIDTSFLVATLTAAIQELNAKFEEYKATHP